MGVNQQRFFHTLVCCMTDQTAAAAGAVENEEDEPPQHIPFPGDSPETMDSLRQEVAALRQKTAALEAANADQAAMIEEWRNWYKQTYRPQMEFLDVEVKRLCSLAPNFANANMNATSADFQSTSRTKASTATSTFDIPFRPPMAKAP